MALFKLARKNAYAKPGRFLLTSLAVLIGVALTTAVLSSPIVSGDFWWSERRY